MSTTVQSKSCPRGDADVLPPHVVDLARERRRRLAAIPRYDRYIARAAGRPALQGSWRDLERRDAEDAERLKDWLDRETADGDRTRCHPRPPDAHGRAAGATRG
jgi:hypothetical protein